METALHRLLAQAVGGYLDSVDRLAVAQQTLVSVELRRLTAAWRALLGQHRACTACPGCRGSGARAGPLCAVWRVAAAYFVRRLPGEGGVVPGR